MSPEEISGSYDGWIVVRRWAATCIDLMLLIALLLLPGMQGERAFFTGLWIWVGFLVLYYPLTEGLTGRTLGKLLCGLKVVKADGGNPGILKAATRTLIRLAEINPLLLGGIPAGICVMTSKKRQRMGDAAAGTFVLKNEDLPLLGAAGPVAAVSLGDFSFQPAPAGPVPIATVPAHLRSSARGKKVLWALPGAIFTSLIVAAMIPLSYAKFTEVEKSLQPTTITCAKFLASPSSKGYYRITGCELDLADAFFETTPTIELTDVNAGSKSSSEETGEEPVDAVIIPVYASREHEGVDSPLVLVSSDEALMKIVEEMRKLHGKDQDTVDQWVEQNAHRMHVTRELTGTVQEASTISDSVRDAMAEDEDTHLAPGYLAFKEGDRPWDPRPWAPVSVGLVAALYAGLFWLLVLINGAGTGERGPYHG